jgi:hypothetical protein
MRMKKKDSLAVAHLFY